jgi:large subunit ribosomal protein L28
MARRCSLTAKAVLAGNKVSHSNRKSRRRFLPNLQEVSLLSDVLNASFKMRITTHALRSIEINGGLDKYLISASSEKLSSEALSLKKRIKKASIIQVG